LTKFRVDKTANFAISKDIKKNNFLFRLGARAATEMMKYMKKNNVSVAKNFLVPLIQVCKIHTHSYWTCFNMCVKG